VTAERYTAVFTGLLGLKKPGEYLYLTMDEDPLGTGAHTLRRDRPPFEKMGREISFEDFPEGCRQLVLDTYRELWSL
jgi:hypothetical protein